MSAHRERQVRGKGRRSNGKLPLLLFARNFLRYPSLVGWMLPSTRFVVNEVLSQVDWSTCRTLIEYGPGVGTFTNEVLSRLRPDGRLIALEVNENFVAYLRSAIHDPRLILVEESAAAVDAVLKRLGVGPADYVLSGIPFKTLNHTERVRIIQKTHGVLREGGVLLVYQLSSTVEPYLRETFGAVRRNVERRSLVPSRMFMCSR